MRLLLGCFLLVGASVYGVTYEVGEAMAVTEIARECSSISCRQDTCAKAQAKLVQRAERFCSLVGGQIRVGLPLLFHPVARLDGYFHCEVSNEGIPGALLCEY